MEMDVIHLTSQNNKEKAMPYSKQLSPGVQIREIDLTNFVPTVGTSGGAFVGEFVWGPVNEYVVINDSNTLSKIFGKPNDYNYVDWFSASNFLAYNDNLKIVRVVDPVTALNSSIDGTGLRVNNLSEYQQLLAADQGLTEVFVARYPGVLGDSLKVSMADSGTFDTWKYKDEFDFVPPGTSDFSAKLGASNDEVHIVVVDEKGKFTGIPGSILEKYSFLSKASDGKGLDNEPNFYGNVINNSSSYLWYFSPVKGSNDLDIESSIDAIQVVDGGSGYGKPIITITDYNPATEEPSAGNGVGASAVATINALGEITAITIVNPGSGYSAPVYVTITDSGSGATAEATVAGGIITGVLPVSVGQDYYSATVTVVDGGEGATAHAVLTATGTTKTVTLNAAGLGYDVGDVLTIVGGTATYTVLTVDTNGEILTGTVAHGSGYSASATGVASTVVPSGGTGATFNIVVGKQIASFVVDTQGVDYGTANVVLTGGNPTTPGTGSAVIGSGPTTMGKITSITLGTAGVGYESAPSVQITPGGSGAVVNAVISEVNTPEEGQIVEYEVVNGGTNYGNPKITVTPGGVDATATATLNADDIAGTNWGLPNANVYGVPRAFYSLKNRNEGAFSKQLSGGSDGDPADASALIAGWDMFKNSEEVDVSLLFVGDGGGSVTSKSVIRHVIDNIAEYRRDCIVFFSPNLSDVLNKDQVTASRAIKTFVTNPTSGVNRNTSFAVCDSGWKLQYDVINDKLRWIPLNADIAGLCAQTETDFDAWWSPAGLNRGMIKNVVSLAFNPSKASRDELYKANINSVVSFTGEGTFLYGDRTQLTKNSAFSYINVRRLFIALEKSIGRAAKYNLFEFNDSFTRAQFVGTVEPFLRMVKARRGIYDFKVICDESNNTPEVIDRAEFVASIFIKPARSINFITLNFVAVRTGVEFSEVVGLV
jgi:phage tail sheath protein FI